MDEDFVMLIIDGVRVPSIDGLSPAQARVVEAALLRS
jgi:hypothetical protein